jgi:hypothetical protein
MERHTLGAHPMTHLTPRRILEAALIFTLSAIAGAWRELQPPRDW